MRLASCLIIAASLVCGGCSTLDYKGAAPSARTLREDPATTDYYYGLNFTFALDRPSDYHPASETHDAASQATASSTPDAK